MLLMSPCSINRLENFVPVFCLSSGLKQVCIFLRASHHPFGLWWTDRRGKIHHTLKSSDAFNPWLILFMGNRFYGINCLSACCFFNHIKTTPNTCKMCTVMISFWSRKLCRVTFISQDPHERGDVRTKSLLFVYSNMKFNLTTVQNFDMKNDDYEKRAEKQL